MSAENNPNDAEGRPHANPRQDAVPDAPAPALNPESSAQPQPAQPQYGQIRQPEYGQMASQYPGWDPYVFGRPEPKDGGESGDAQSGAASDTAARTGTAAPAQGRPGVVRRPPLSQQQLGFNPYPYGAPEQPDDGGEADGARGQVPAGPRMEVPGQGGALGQGGANDPRFVMQPVDLDDPNQNPLYGRWDTMAVVAMVCAWMFPPVGLVLALFSMRRTRVFHMRGRALAIAALVIAIINTIVDVIVSIYGIGWYVNWVYQLTGVDMSQMLNSMGLDAGSVGGSGGTSVSA